MIRQPPTSTLLPFPTPFRSPLPLHIFEPQYKEMVKNCFEEKSEFGMLLSLPKGIAQDRKSTRLNSSHGYVSYAAFCLTKKILFRPASSCIMFLLRSATRLHL